MLGCSLTLHSDFAQCAGVARRAGGEAHVLSWVVCRHVVQNECAKAVWVLNDDVMRIRFHGTPVCLWNRWMNYFTSKKTSRRETPKIWFLTFVPGDLWFGGTGDLAGELYCLSELCCAVCQHCVKIWRACNKSKMLHFRNMVYFYCFI